MNCFYCNTHDVKLQCERCSLPFCGKECQQNAAICEKIQTFLPKFPIPKHQAFLPAQTNSGRVFNIYGTSVIKTAMRRNRMDTREFQNTINTVLAARRSMLKRPLPKIQASQWAVIEGFEQDSVFTFESYVLSPMHSRDTWAQMRQQFLIYADDMREAIVDNMNIIRIRYVWSQIIKFALTNDDFIINGDDFIRQYISVARPPRSNSLIHEMRRSKEKVIASFRKMWFRKNWDYDAIALPVTTNMFSFLQQTVSRKIAKNTIFYRGSKSNTKQIKYKTAWFGMEPFTAMGYIIPATEMDVEDSTLQSYCKAVGVISAFKVKKKFFIIDLSNVKNVKFLQNMIKNTTSNEILEAYNTSWSLLDNESVVIRKSILKKDLLWTDWLCKQGFVGYVANKGMGLHAEIFLCDWKNYVDYLGSYDNERVLQFGFCTEPYRSTNITLYNY